MMFNWVETDQVHGSDLRSILLLAGGGLAVVAVIAVVFWWLVRGEW